MTSEPSRLTLISGDEDLLVVRAIEAVVARARAEAPDVEVSEFDGADATPGQIAEALSPSLFGGPRVLIVRNGQDVKKELAAAILADVKALDESARLVVAHAGGAKGKAFADGLKAAGATVAPAGKITRHRERVEFVSAEFRRCGGRGSEDAASSLIAAVGADLRELAAAVAQLVADTGGRVTGETVARYYRGRAEVSGFAVADAAITGDVPAALEALRWALQIGVDPVPIADALADGVRTVARVASAGRGNAYQLASSLGMPPWKVERAQRQARGWSAAGLAAAMHAAARCNADVKGGSDDRGYALERAVFAMSAARASGDGR